MPIFYYIMNIRNIEYLMGGSKKKVGSRNCYMNMNEWSRRSFIYDQYN